METLITQSIRFPLLLAVVTSQILSKVDRAGAKGQHLSEQVKGYVSSKDRRSELNTPWDQFWVSAQNMKPAWAGVKVHKLQRLVVDTNKPAWPSIKKDSRVKMPQWALWICGSRSTPPSQHRLEKSTRWLPGSSHRRSRTELCELIETVEICLDLLLESCSKV